MKPTKLHLALALLVGLGLLVAACGGSNDAAPPPEAAAPAAPAEAQPQAPAAPPATETPAPAEPAAAEPAPAGGTVRIGWEGSFDFSDGFDPTGEYVGEAYGIMSNLLVRTLVGYKHIAGPAGNDLVPDLAVAMPDLSEDGLTYTFHLKDGIKFGPPLNREITSDDVRFAFERIGTESVAAQYGFYYSVIEGMGDFLAGEAETISGIRTPDDKTVAFKLVEPTGDFPFRLAMPATGPMPREVAGCFTDAGVYGQYVVSSGPYMIAGSDQQDVTSCETLAPLSGFDPNAKLELVRNPAYDASTDDPAARTALPDGFVFEVNTNAADIFAKIKAGELDGEVAGPPPAVIREYTETAGLADRIRQNNNDTTWYLSMNLTQAPFDDIHVRRAANLVMNKDGLRRAWGGASRGEIATHIVPNAVLNDRLRDYDPYPSDNGLGNVEAARAEMALSRYDSDGDGICDAPECKNILHVAGTREIDNSMVPVIEESLSKIGISLRTRQLDNSYQVLTTTDRNVPFTSRPGWGKDFADASTFAVLFDGRSIAPQGNVNFSLVGLAPAVAEKLGVTGAIEAVPNVDRQIDRCNGLPVGDQRVGCWADFDKMLMEEVVPWVPFLDSTSVDIIGPAVTSYGFDQFSGAPAWAHWGVDPSRQSGS